MNRRTLAFLGAAVLAVVGAGLLFLSARGSDDDGSLQASASDSVAAPAEDTDGADVPSFTDDEPVDDAAAPSDDVDSGEPADDIAAAGTGIAEIVDVPEEMVEITAALDTQRAIGGQVRPGDLVGIIVSYDDLRLTDFVLHKILVSNVQDEAPVEIVDGTENLLEAAPSGRFYVTFAMEAADAEKMTHALEFGRIWLTYEPETADETSPGVQSSETVLESAGFLPELDTVSS